VFDKFPDLKVVVLESGGGWIGYWLDRIDAVYGHTFIGTRVPLEHKPSDYFRERIWISCDPDERTIPALAERFGADRFMWASDFPHADHTPEYLTDLTELAAAFPDADRRTFLGDNARSLFAIPDTAVVSPAAG
jgi:predicted TIM-barrel fold metal-dependent hydrolase